MNDYICKCGKKIKKSTNAATTGYIIENFSEQHECFGCPYIVVERDWKTRDITKRECRTTPTIAYRTQCKIGTEPKDHTMCYLYTLDLQFAKRVFRFINEIDGAEKGGTINRVPDEWRAADFHCNGLCVFPLYFKANKSGYEARKAVKERFFNDDGTRKGETEDSEKEIILQRIEIAKENASSKVEANIKSEEVSKMQSLNFNAMISQSNQLKSIPLEMLVPYHNHKFQLYSGERLEDMVQSIKENGVLTPIIVRPSGDKYEILAGHNRTNAAKLAGLTSVPGVVKENLSDEDAEMYVIETNLMQRGFDDLQISEQATVIAMRHSQMFSEEKRAAIANELTVLNNNSPLGNSKLEQVGNEYGLGKNSVARLIRVDKLIDKLKSWVDSKELSIRAAVELSYISENAQEAVFERHDLHENGEMRKLDISLAQRYREIFYGFSGSVEQARNVIIKNIVVQSTLNGEKKSPKAIKVSLNMETYQKYFDEDTKPKDVADIVDKALQLYFDVERKSTSVDI